MRYTITPAVTDAWLDDVFTDELYYNVSRLAGALLDTQPMPFTLVEVETSGFDIGADTLLGVGVCQGICTLDSVEYRQVTLDSLAPPAAGELLCGHALTHFALPWLERHLPELADYEALVYGRVKADLGLLLKAAARPSRVLDAETDAEFYTRINAFIMGGFRYSVAGYVLPRAARTLPGVDPSVERVPHQHAANLSVYSLLRIRHALHTWAVQSGGKAPC